MIIDVFCHILPKKYQAALDQKVTNRDRSLNTARYTQTVPSLLDLETRFRVMDRFTDYVQVLTVAAPTPYSLATPEVTAELCRIANDELAELVNRYPERFVAGIACLPMNDMEAALKEADRAVRDLRLRGVEVTSDINGKPLDSPEFFPLFEKMADYDLPVLIHPQKEMNIPDYAGEPISKYRVWTKMGWPFATALAMTRLVYGRVKERLPGLKVVGHHCGGLIPFLAGRITWNDDFNEMAMGHRDIFLKKNALEYYRDFYYDTAVNGHTPSLVCGLSFCGEDRMVFATDMPFDHQLGKRLIGDTIDSVERMGLTQEQKKKIYFQNAIRLMRLPVSGF